MSETLAVRVPAKINLHLRVGAPRADGFHPILSWMVTVGLFDTLTLVRSKAPGLSLQTDRPDVPVGGDNLVLKAARLLCDAARARLATAANSPLAAEIALHKQIPMGAGLGGGSSDAAHTLAALNRFWSLGCGREELSALAAKLGSDVPFFLHGPSAICTGRGEIVRPAPPPAIAWAVLLLPPFAVPTPAVYRRFDQMGRGEVSAIADEPDWHEWSRLSAGSLLPLLVNDLEAPAFALEAELGRLRDRAERTLSRIVRMSGSGSSLFSLFDSPEEARAAADRIAADLQIRAVCAEIAPQTEIPLNNAAPPW